MKFFYEKFWVPFFGYILSKFVFLIEGKKQDSKNKKITDDTPSQPSGDHE